MIEIFWSLETKMCRDIRRSLLTNPRKKRHAFGPNLDAQQQKTANFWENSYLWWRKKPPLGSIG